MTGSRTEVAAGTDLAGELLAFLVDTVEGVHEGIGQRVFTAIGPLAEPTRSVHDGIRGAVYAMVRGGIRGVLAGAGAVASRHPRWKTARPLTQNPSGGQVLAAVSGIVGDGIAERQPELDIGMGIRVAGDPVEVAPQALALAFPTASEDVAVFVHGLCETESVWRYRSRAHRAAARLGEATPVRSIGDALADAHAVTPVHLRYNTGRRISDNGARLAALLSSLVAAWPVPVRSLTLVGHSMGGLVIRSACATGVADGQAWPGLVRHAVYLGTPHLGAPLEKAVNAGAWLLDLVPETRAFARFLRRRSVGVRDLRHGSLTADDWRHRDPDALRGVPPLDVPLLATAEHHVVCGAVTRSTKHPVGRAVGDLLVRTGSATGRGRRRSVPFVQVVERTGVNHFDLTTDPEVVGYLADRLAPECEGRQRRLGSRRTISIRQASATDPAIDG